jgi:hypothetical protein
MPVTKMKMLEAMADAMPQDMSFTCPLTVEAATDSQPVPRFRMVAYTGGQMRISGFPHPVVVDLEGLSVDRQDIPVRLDHNPRQGVGHTQRVAIENGQVIAEGLVSRDTSWARDVAKSSGNGFPWQASIGAAVVQAEFVPRGARVTVNGKTFDGPLHVVRKAVLKEISFVDSGADSATSARIAAQHTQGEHMTFEQWLEAKGFEADKLSDQQKVTLKAAYDSEQAGDGTDGTDGNDGGKKVQASSVDDVIRAARLERDRQDAIANLVASAIAQPGVDIDALERIGQEAIRAKWTVDQADVAIIRAARAAPPGIIKHRDDSRKPDVIEAGLAMSAGLSKPEDHYSEQTLEAASRAWKHGLTIGEALLLTAAAHGQPQQSIRNVRSVLEAAFPGRDIRAAGVSTISLPGILSNVANKFLLAGFEAVEQAWRSVSVTRPVTDFKAITSYRLTGGFDFEEVGPSGELKHGKVGEENFTNKADTYGKMFAITRQDIINDDMGALSAVPRRIGRGGALKLNTVFWTAFLNNAAFFTAARGNFDDGADTALSIDALSAADILFRDIKDADDNPTGIEPKILLVPNALRLSAFQLVRSPEIRQSTDADGTGASYTTDNPHRGMYNLVSSAYLQSAAIANSSNKAWYLLADPQDLPVIEVVFLNGQQSPTVESADADFNTLGIQMRGYFDFGVAKQDYRGGVKMKGEV